MHTYKVGDSVVHWIYGIGKIIAIADKGLPGYPCFYYIIEGNKQTLWVPVEEKGRSSLHLPISRSDFKQLIQVLRSLGEDLSNNPYQRHNQLDERVQKASPNDLCLVIRDLNYRSHGRKLSSNDTRILKHAQSFLLDEWERSLGTPREQASQEMEWILKENQAQRPFFTI
ncbi:MAG TPA: CarD family transcriptional regulator [Anaerolineales bacterium]|nr:CarD family transcriptional regulator [Anaerolineales bacterium]